MRICSVWISALEVSTFHEGMNNQIFVMSYYDVV